MGEDFGT